jgi:CDP-diacylglycerol--serine O-phosphatidyltransferase
LFTAGNLFCGFMAIMKCIQARYNVMLDVELESPSELYTQAVLFILGGMVCDSLDGRVARMGGRESLFGKEFDSIVDMVSFGVAPALMVLFLILNPEESLFFKNIGWFLSFIYLLCAGVRLSRFNVITHPLVYPANIDRTNSDFIGLPVPAAAGMIATLVLVITTHDLQRWAIALPFLMIFISYLMPGSLSQFQGNRLEHESTFADIRPPPHVRHSNLHVQAIRLGSYLSWLPILWRYPPRSHDATHSKSSKSQTIRIFSQINSKTPANNP